MSNTATAPSEGDVLQAREDKVRARMREAKVWVNGYVMKMTADDPHTYLFKDRTGHKVVNPFQGKDGQPVDPFDAWGADFTRANICKRLEKWLDANPTDHPLYAK